MGEIRSAQEELSAAFQEAGRSFYAQAQPDDAGAAGGAPGGPGGPGAPGAGDAGATEGAGAGAGATAGRPDDAVEADYEIVDEGKK